MDLGIVLNHCAEELTSENSGFRVWVLQNELQNGAKAATEADVQVVTLVELTKL